MYIVMTSSAKMPNTCWGKYRNVAVVEIDQEYTARDWRPKMISARAKGVLRIVREYGPQSVGKTERCAYERAIKAAEDLALQLNNGRDLAGIEAIIGAGGSA